MLTYLEDFLEYIGGYRDNQGKSLSSASLFSLANIRLANYDQNIVSTIGYQTFTGGALTDRQYALVNKLVTKYRRQLQQKGIIVPDSLPLRMPLRQINRSKTLSYDSENADLLLKFPYDNNLVQSIRQLIPDSCGTFEFNRDIRAWVVAATLPNLVRLVDWANDNKFEIAFDYEKLLDQLYQEIAVPELELNEEQSLMINNDPGSIPLEQFLEHLDNPLKLLVRVSEYQLLVGKNLLSHIQKFNLEETWMDWSLKKKIQIDPTQYSIDNFLDWVDATEQFPVVWHSSDTLLEQKLISRYGKEAIQVLTGKKRPQPDFKFYLIPILGTNKTFFNKEEIAILVTGQSIIYNLKKHSSVRSKKIVYWGSDMLLNK